MVPRSKAADESREDAPTEIVIVLRNKPVIVYRDREVKVSAEDRRHPLETRQQVSYRWRSTIQAMDAVPGEQVWLLSELCSRGHLAVSSIIAAHGRGHQKVDRLDASSPGSHARRQSRSATRRRISPRTDRSCGPEPLRRSCEVELRVVESFCSRPRKPTAGRRAREAAPCAEGSA